MRKKLLGFLTIGVLVMGLFGCGKSVNNQKLISYSVSSGGGMTGGGSSSEIKYVGGDLLLVSRTSEYWFEDDTVKEYLIDEAVLEEIGDVFKKYKMSGWHNKTFTDMFVADGPSTSYSFSFSDGGYIYFSSQIYPEKYSSKLSEISDIVKKYTETATLLPGLIKPQLTEEEQVARQRPSNGEVSVEVYEYSRSRLEYRIMNGTEEDIEVEDNLVITDANGNIIRESKDEDPLQIYAYYADEESVKIDKRLEPGKYVLTIGEYSCEFEIGLAE